MLGRERDGNINGAQLLGRELLLGWSWGGAEARTRSVTLGEDTVDPELLSCPGFEG